MQGVVPAAGEGTRLRPLTADRPKALVEVADEPMPPLLPDLVDAGEEHDGAVLVETVSRAVTTGVAETDSDGFLTNLLETGHRPEYSSPR
jgi:dTDP-glucose pyrophosphorylase